MFTSITFKAKDASKAACLFAGYKGKIASFDHTINTLNKLGYTVFAYEHSAAVLKNGNPYDLLDMLDEIHRDVFGKITEFKEVICIGVSLGVGIGFSFQRLAPQKIKYGIYAGAGISPSESIFESPLFYFARRSYLKKGYDQQKLYDIWEEHEITPFKPLSNDAGFTIVLGKRDAIVKYKRATETYNAWIKAGVPIKIITKNNLGHIGTIKWFKSNIGRLLNEYERPDKLV